MTWMAKITFLTVSILIVVYVLFTIWVTIGGWFDLRAMLRDLMAERVNEIDDGRVDPGALVEGTNNREQPPTQR